MTQLPPAAVLSLSGALTRIAEAIGASPMQDSVVRTLYGFLCDGKFVAIGDIANHEGIVLQSKATLLPEDWQSSLSEAEFFRACHRPRVLRLANTREGPLFVINVRIITSELDGLLYSISQSPQRLVSPTDTATTARGDRRTGLADRPGKEAAISSPADVEAVPEAGDKPLEPTSSVSLSLEEAIERAIVAKGLPPPDIRWPAFCHEVRRLCGVKDDAYGYGDRTIKNRVGKRGKR